MTKYEAKLQDIKDGKSTMSIELLNTLEHIRAVQEEGMKYYLDLLKKNRDKRHNHD